MNEITKLVLPVAGEGVRLKPLTLDTPKALLRVGGRPLLEYALLETRGTAVRQVILVVNHNHRADFDKYVEETRKKFPELDFYVRVQEELLGTGHSILQAEDLLKSDDAFMVRYVDDLLVSDFSVLKSLSNLFETYPAPILILTRVPEAQVSRYGVVKAEEVNSRDGIYRILELVEKPKLEEAPSNLIFVGGGVLNKGIIKELLDLEQSAEKRKDSLPVTDALVRYLSQGNLMYGWKFKGKRFDCGSLEGLREAESNRE